jgi:hypothetical protein
MGLAVRCDLRLAANTGHGAQEAGGPSSSAPLLLVPRAAAAAAAAEEVAGGKGSMGSTLSSAVPSAAAAASRSRSLGRPRSSAATLTVVGEADAIIVVAETINPSSSLPRLFVMCLSPARPAGINQECDDSKKMRTRTRLMPG